MHYAQGWALFHDLLQTGRDEARTFDRLFAALVEGAPHDEALRRAWPDEDWPALDAAVKAHARGMKRDLDTERRKERDARR